MRKGKSHFLECGSLSNCRHQSRISLTSVAWLEPAGGYLHAIQSVDRNILYVNVKCTLFLIGGQRIISVLAL